MDNGTHMETPDSLVSYLRNFSRSSRTFLKPEIGEVNKFEGGGGSLPDINTTRKPLAGVCTTDISVAMYIYVRNKCEINARYGRSLRDDFRRTSEFARDHNNEELCVLRKSRNKPLIT